jgi:phosphoserine aminotransferase
MQRPFNFSAGPATMPPAVLAQAAEEMLDWPDANGVRCGMGVMEMSHRGSQFISIYEQAVADLRELLAVPAHFKILFMQGGGLAENAIVPMNLSALRANAPGAADFVVTGSWSDKSALEAHKYCSVQVAASGAAEQFVRIPEVASWRLREQASYLHICSNETIHGVEFHSLPDLKALGSEAELVVDFSSQIASRSVDWSRIGLGFGGAQKNLGPAGLTLVVVREDLLGRALPICPSAFDYQKVADHHSMYNTPPTYAIYMAGLVFQWLKQQGGIAAIERANIAKAELLYRTVDSSSLYYNPVHPDCRSRMNVPFFLREERLNDAFLEGAKAAGLLQLKGHKSVGGMRASLYNAMPLAGVQALVDFMTDFERKRA